MSLRRKVKIKALKLQQFFNPRQQTVERIQDLKRLEKLEKRAHKETVQELRQEIDKRRNDLKNARGTGAASVWRREIDLLESELRKRSQRDFKKDKKALKKKARTVRK